MQAGPGGVGLSKGHGCWRCWWKAEGALLSELEEKKRGRWPPPRPRPLVQGFDGETELAVASPSSEGGLSEVYF